MSWTLIIITLLIGLTLAVLEIVALPGGIAGACGAILCAIAIWQTYLTHGTMAGHIVLAASLAVGIALLVFFLKSRTWRHFELNEEVDSKTNTVDPEKVAVGDTGITLSRLAPSGNALINGQTVEVHTVSEFIDPDQPIKVIDIDGYKVTVEPCPAN